MHAQYVNAGDVIADKYRVDRVLGVGGMGIVVAATHLVLNQQVAIKLLLPTSNQSLLARFTREAQAMAQLRSEHVCRVQDVGTHRGGRASTPFIVMELLVGQDLAHAVARRRFSMAETIDVIMQALEAIAEAHAVGIVHRDLKPANLFATTANDGTLLVKVLDFGISKMQGSATQTQEMMGTPAYMAPEQIQSTRSVDARADLYALGVIAYELVTGVNPFAGATLAATIMSVLGEEPMPIAHVAPGFAQAIARCLRKSPDARFANAGELAMAFAPYGSPATAELARKIGRLARGSGPVVVPPVGARAHTPSGAPVQVGLSAMPAVGHVATAPYQVGHAPTSAQPDRPGSPEAAFVPARGPYPQLPGAAHASVHPAVGAAHEAAPLGPVKMSRAKLGGLALIAMIGGGVGVGLATTVMTHRSRPADTQAGVMQPALHDTSGDARPATTAAMHDATPATPSGTAAPQPAIIASKPGVGSAFEPAATVAGGSSPARHVEAAPSRENRSSATSGPSGTPSRPIARAPAVSATVARSSPAPQRRADATGKTEIRELGDPAKQPQAAPELAPIEPPKPAAIDYAAFEHGLAFVRGAIHLCGEQHPASVSVTFHIVIAPTGEVRASADRNFGTSQCVLKVLDGMSYPATERGGAFDKTYFFGG